MNFFRKNIFLIILFLLFCVGCSNNESKEKITLIEFNDNFVELEFGETYKVEYKVTPSSLNPNVEFELTNDIVSIDENNLMTATGAGEAILIVKALDGSGVMDQMSILIKDTEAPVVEYVDEQNYKLAIGTKNWNPLDGIKVVDNIDGDITDKVEVLSNDVNPEIYGTYLVKYKATDSCGNYIKFTRTVEVVWPYSVVFIGHAGGYFGIMNTMDAIKYSVEVLHYPMIEVDLQATSDGVFVLCHDEKFGNYSVKNTPWSTFENYYITKERNSGLPAKEGLVTNSPYTSRICLLTEALDYCREHNTTLKIELKESKTINGSTTAGMQKLMDIIEEHDMLELTSFTCFPYMKDNLIWLREHGYDNVIQYLCGTCEKQETLDLCIKYNFIAAINPIYGDYSNRDEWLQKYYDAGVKLSAYTFDQNTSYQTVQTWIDKGISYITTDWHDPSKLKMPAAK